MDLPAGQWLVAAIGLVIVGYAVNLARRGWTEKFAEHLDTEGKLGYSGATYLLLGKIGHIAKGIALAIVGVLFCYAGVTHEPGKSGGLDEALSDAPPAALRARHADRDRRGHRLLRPVLLRTRTPPRQVTRAASGSPGPSPASGPAAASGSWSAGGTTRRSVRSPT